MEHQQPSLKVVKDKERTNDARDNRNFNAKNKKAHRRAAAPFLIGKDTACKIDGERNDAPEIRGIINHTDLFPWYWLSYGEKCYAFSTVEAFPLKENDEYPEPGTELVFSGYETSGNCIWKGVNDVEMMINKTIADIEEQCGDVICKFIAEAHAYHLKHYFNFDKK